MIGWISGRLHRKSAQTIIVDAGGVGYELDVPLRTFEELPEEDHQVSLDVLTVYRAEQVELYGFGSPAERDLFKALLAVSGIGPRLALAMVSSLSIRDLHDAIAQNRTAILEEVPGIGRKTAQRLLVELRDRLPEPPADAAGPRGARREGTGDDSGVEADAISALVNLGYRESEASRAVAAVLDAGEAPDLVAVIRQALRRFAR